MNEAGVLRPANAAGDSEGALGVGQGAEGEVGECLREEDGGGEGGAGGEGVGPGRERGGAGGGEDGVYADGVDLLLLLRWCGLERAAYGWIYIGGRGGKEWQGKGSEGGEREGKGRKRGEGRTHSNNSLERLNYIALIQWRDIVPRDIASHISEEGAEESDFKKLIHGQELQDRDGGWREVRRKWAI